MKPFRIALGILGLIIILYAVASAAVDDGVKPVGHLTFMAIVVIGHDLVLVPMAVGVGALVSRFAPAWARGPALGALFASAIVTLVALPFVIGAGRRADDPSALPLNYARGVIVVLAIIWLAAATLALYRRHARA